MSTITSGMKSARSTRLGGGGDLTAAVADSVAGEGAEGEAGFVVAAPVWGSSRVRQPISTSVRIKDRKSTRLNSSHSQISYAVFCLKKKNCDALRTRSSGARL